MSSMLYPWKAYLILRAKYILRDILYPWGAYRINKCRSMWRLLDKFIIHIFLMVQNGPIQSLFEPGHHAWSWSWLNSGQNQSWYFKKLLWRTHTKHIYKMKWCHGPATANPRHGQHRAQPRGLGGTLNTRYCKALFKSQLFSCFSFLVKS